MSSFVEDVPEQAKPGDSTGARDDKEDDAADEDGDIKPTKRRKSADASDMAAAEGEQEKKGG